MSRSLHAALGAAWNRLTTLRVPVLLALLALLVVLPTASGSAAVGHKFLGVVPARGTTAAQLQHTLNELNPAVNPLTYHGGPVMHSNNNYAIYWEPSGHTTPDSYKNTIDSYFRNVAADSGKGSNVYAVGTEYTDSTGASAAYNSSFAGRIVDTNPYPASGCAETTGPCLTDAQIQTELARIVSANHLPMGTGTIYFMMTPQNVRSCFDGSGSSCSYSQYCAYHAASALGQTAYTLYADQPYGAANGCDMGQRPNGDAADPTINLISHEGNESITDPLGNAWYDVGGNENGDKCAWNFGGLLGNSGAQYNQVINGAHYFLQQEWTNKNSGCAQTGQDTQPPPPPPPPPATDAILNGGFENGIAPWVETSTGGYQLIGYPGARVHSGSKDAWLGDYVNSTDTIAQTFTAQVGSPKLTYWWSMESQETGAAKDYMILQIYNAAGNVVRQKGFSNTSARNVWTQDTIGLSGLSGQKLTMKFIVINNATKPTGFFLDDFSVK